MKIERWEAEKLLNFSILELYDARVAGEQQVSYDWIKERAHEILRYIAFLEPKIQQPIEGDFNE